ncbi:uncharacterized protein [Oscarella lobularis]|uniref:uncharacterized protein n=1 Tax=Oscarella lobularis TaxID=121494 RepID=UPI0033139B5C
MKSYAAKVVLIGDERCGKSSVCEVFRRGTWPRDYEATVEEKWTDCVTTVGKRKHAVNMTVVDTSGQEAYDRLRPLSYDDTDIVAICFDISSASSLANVVSKWHVEAKNFCSSAFVVLVGCKADKRQIESRLSSISQEQAIEVAGAIGAKHYVECSAFDRPSVKKVFECAGEAAIKRRRKLKSRNSWWRGLVA